MPRCLDGMSSPPHFHPHLLNSQAITAGAPPRQSRASSAFSRLANIAALSAGTTTTASGAAAAAPAASSPTVAASAPTATDLVHLPPPSATSRSGALDALETIAHADHDRWRSKSTGPPPPPPLSTTTATSATSARVRGDDKLAATTNESAAHRYEPRARASGSRTGWRARDLSESRSRERRPPLTFGDVSGSGFSGLGGGGGAGGGGTSYLGSVSESPSSLSFRTGWAGSGGGILGNSVGGAGGGEQLPPNASYSAFSTFGGPAGGVDSHFFPHSSSAFSFEMGGSVSNSPWDSSYRSSLAGSPSPFNSDTRSSSVPRQPSGLPSPLQPRSDPTAATTSAGNLYSSLAAAGGSRNGLDSLHASPPTRSPASVPASFARTSSPIGGGRKLKDSSRGLRYTVATPARDKGLVGLAKPPKDAEQGRVAVAGKTSLKILRVPHGTRRKREPSPQPPPSRDDSDTETLSRRARAVEAVQAAFPASSIAARRSRSRGSPAPHGNNGSGFASYSSSIRDGSTPRFGLDEELAEREVVTEVMDVRIGSKLGPTYLFSDVRWGYGGDSLAVKPWTGHAEANFRLVLQPHRTRSRRPFRTARWSCGT